MSISSQNLHNYITKRNVLFLGRAQAIDEILNNVQNLNESTVSLENALFISVMDLKKLIKADSCKENKSLKVRFLPSEKGRIKVRGPEFKLVGNNKVSPVSHITTKSEALVVARRFALPEQQNDIASKLLQVCGLYRLYENRIKMVMKVSRILGVAVESSGEVRGFDGFRERRQAHLDKLISVLGDKSVRYSSMILHLDEAAFHFNSIGGNKRGYHAITLSWDLPRKLSIKPDLYENSKLTFKYVAYNLRGSYIVKPLSEFDPKGKITTDDTKPVDLPFKNTIRPTRRVIKALGIDRFRRPILEWVNQYYHLIPEVHKALNEFSLIKDALRNV
jgi:hypothetical protein